MIELKNIELLKLEDVEIEGVSASKTELSTLKIGSLPVLLRVGAVRYRIGDVNKFYMGAHAITGDLTIALKGKLELVVKNNKIRPEAYVFELE